VGTGPIFHGEPPVIALYFHYADDDTLLYVGVSSSVFIRQDRHSREARWFSQVRRISIIRFETLEEAKEAEASIIKNRMPVYNTVHNVSVYTNHLVRLHHGDWERLKKFYPKPTRIIRALVSKHLKDNGALTDGS
jgi:excinuclease UvrABC nuclease subunit